MSQYVTTTPVASSIPYDNATTGYGTGDVQSALDGIASSIAAGIVNYNITSTTAFVTTATTDVVITSFTLTPSAGTYLALYNA